MHYEKVEEDNAEENNNKMGKQAADNKCSSLNLIIAITWMEPPTVIADQGCSRRWRAWGQGGLHARNIVTFAHDSRDARHAEIQHRANKILRRDILHSQISRAHETKQVFCKN